MAVMESTDNCLVCLQAGGKLNIFTTYNICKGKEELYFEVIKNCFNIEITPDSGLTEICNECSIKLRKAYTFRHEVLQAVERMLLTQTQVTNTNEKQYSEIEYLEDIPAESNCDINTLLNSETGQISHTLNQIYENEKICESDVNSYLNDIGNDAEVDKLILNETNDNTGIREEKREIIRSVPDLNLEPGEICFINKTVENGSILIQSDILVDKKEVILKSKGKTNVGHNKVSKTKVKYKAGPIYTEDEVPVTIITDLDGEVIENKKKVSKQNKEKNVRKKDKTALNQDDTLEKINTKCLKVDKNKISKRCVKKAKKDKSSLPQFSTVEQKPEESYTMNNRNEINESEAKNNPISYLMDIGNDVNERSSSKPRKSVKRKKNAGKTEDTPVKENMSDDVEETKAIKRSKKEKKAKEPVKPFTLQPGQTVCDLCKAQFETHKALGTHMNTHYPQFVCPMCGTEVATKSRLRAHQLTHDEGPFACKICDKQFSNANTRNAHAWRVHSKTDPFKCRHCDARFPTFLQRLRHLQSAHDEKQEYPCQFCGAKFAYAAYRTKHIRTMHLNERPHKCPQCPAAFARARELNAHRASKHGHGERSHRCGVCGRAFYLLTALRWHVNQHTNKYECSQCEQKFATSAELSTHTQLHEHTDSIAINLDFVTSLQLDSLADDYALIDPSYLDMNEL